MQSGKARLAAVPDAAYRFGVTEPKSLTPTALIVVAREVVGAPGGLAALLPIAGRPLIEHLARRAAEAGAGALLIVAATVSPELAAVADRLRRHGLPTRIALGAADAAARADAAPLLLIADGVLPGEAELRAVASAEAPALLVAADAPERDAWERIDATTRWAGLAMLPADALDAAAAMPDDWDLELVLVRPLAGNATRIAGVTTRVDTAVAAQAAGDALIPAGPGVERAMIGWLAERRVDARAVRIGALAAAWAGAALTGFGPLWAAFALLIAAAPLDRLGRRLAVARLEPARHGRGWRHGRLAALASALGLVGWRLSGAPGYEPLLLAVVAAAMLVAARNQAHIAGLHQPGWAARPTVMLWLAAPFVLAGYGRWALGGLALWSAASLFHLQWRGLRASSG